jgi:glycosyltransferase involved in cell wall biosynthesis
MINGRKIAVVIPSFKVTKHIIDVIDNISSDVDQIYVVDDACPENSGNFVINNTNDNRIKVVFNEINLGVGGAVLAGYKQALNDKNDIVVKIDGDGQMNPELIKDFIKPILLKTAD